MQAVIVAGGLATRLGPLTRETPKAMLSFGGRPFLAHQLDLLRGQEVRDVVVCIGHLGEQIVDHFGDGGPFGVRLRYSRDEQLGTGGALRCALPLLVDRFFVTWGDSYVPADLRAAWSLFARSEAGGLVVVHENHDRYDRSNIALDGPYVAAYDKQRTSGRVLTHIDAGISILPRAAVAAILPDRVASLEQEIFSPLARARRLLAFETRDRFYEIGSLAGIEDFRVYLAGRSAKVEAARA